MGVGSRPRASEKRDKFDTRTTPRKRRNRTPAEGGMHERVRENPRRGTRATTAGDAAHLVISDGAKRTIPLEARIPLPEVAALATVAYNTHDLAAAISSGSFQTEGMIVAPCSMRTLAAIANSYDTDLLIRAAD